MSNTPLTDGVVLPCKIIRWLVWLAWFDWVQVTVFSTLGAPRPELLGLGIPTLLTQALLIFGMGLGSNIARVSYIFWTVLAIVLEVAGGDVYGSVAPFAELWTTVGHILTAVLLGGLLLPLVYRNFSTNAKAQRLQAAPALRQRRIRNLRIAACWASVLPMSLVAVPLFHTPILAVVLSATPAVVVAIAIAARQLFCLRREQRAAVC